MADGGPQGQPRRGMGAVLEDPSRCLIAFEVDSTGRVSRWTEGAARVLGWSAEQTLGDEPPVPSPWPDEAPWHEIVGRPGALLDQPAVWPTADGSFVELTISTSPCVGHGGVVEGVIVSARDISARRVIEEQLAVYARDIRETYGRELHSLADLELSYRATVEALASAVEAKDDTTGGHIRRVSRLGQLIATAHLGEQAEDPQLEYGFLLHDVGKLAVPDAVLNKPSALDAFEWELMRRHPEAGARILNQIPFLGRAIDVVRHHHERWDGKGYPSGLRGEQIPIGARIFSIADTVDAMTSDRPYRKGMPLSDALAEVRKQSGLQFDPACVDTFNALPQAQLRALLEHPEDH